MKTVTKKNDVTRMGIQKTTQCGMVVNAKAFELLARQYSDPAKAIIQEIGANAADSHVRAGKEDIPFSVKLPNSLDPHLRIRDYGIGMSKDIIYNVYINYMQSDKTKTNTETGCFGIGSKTPLAYADQFNITTYNDGVMTMYSLVKNEEGVPELNEFGDYDTDEENGVEISFSVKEDDFDRFGRKAYEVYSFFKTRPTVTGNGSYDYKKEEEPILEGDSWKLYGGYGDAYAVMGNIAYPLDEDQFEYRSKYREFLCNDSRIEIPLGDLNITPSREALEYTEHTIKGIKKAIDKVLGEIDSQVELEMSECKSWWEAKMLSAKIKGKIHGVPELPSLDEFGGISLKYNPELKIKRIYRLNSSKVKASNYDDHTATVHVQKNTQVVIKDIDKGFCKRCRYFTGENDVVVYLVTQEVANENGGIAGIMDILHVIEEDNVVMLASELPEPPKTTSSNKGISHGTRKKTASMREFCPEGDNRHYARRYQARWWTEAEVDIKNDPDKKLYVRWNNYETTSHDGRTIEPKRLYEAFSALGITVPTIYGLKDNQVSTAAKQENWMDLKEWASMALKTFLDQNEGWEKSLQYRKIAEDNDWIKDLSEIFEKYNISVTLPESPMGKLIDGLSGRGISKFSMNILAIARQVSYNLEYEETDSSLDSLIDDASKSYPFIVKMLDRTYMSGYGQEAVENLFEMVDAFDRIKLEGGC